MTEHETAAKTAIPTIQQPVRSKAALRIAAINDRAVGAEEKPRESDHCLVEAAWNREVAAIGLEV